MASARLEQARNQRLSSSALTKIASSGRRVLSLATVSNRIASQTQDALDADYQARYNDGLISPEEYSTYLTSVLGRSGLTATDKVKLQSTIRNVQTDAEETLLQSNYQQAADGTSSQVAAAKALSDFYKQNANTLVAGTPASSTAMANAAKWDQQAQTLTDNMEKAARKTARLKSLAQISTLDSKDPQTAVKKAQLYANLRDQATADGDTNEAAQWDAKSNAEVASAQTLATSQTKGKIVDYMNSNLDQYRDKKIGPYDMMNVLNDAEKAADQTGDYTLALRIDNMRQGIQNDIKSAEGKALGGFKKQANETLDTIEMDLSNLESAFRYGTPFTPESQFFKQYVKGAGVPTLEDMVTLRALGFAASQDVVKQMEDAGVDVAESRRASIQTNVDESMNQRQAFTQGTLLAVIDPGDGEVKLETVSSPEEGSKYITDKNTGLSFSLINKNDSTQPGYFETLQKAVAGGYASPDYATTIGTLTGTGAGGQVKEKRSFLGADWLAPDKVLSLDTNTPLYGVGSKDGQTGAYKDYAIKESDLKEGGDPNKFVKVDISQDAKTGVRTVNVTSQQVSPNYTIDPVIVAPDANGQLDRIYVKKDPVTGAVKSYYSQNLGQTVQPDQLTSLYRTTNSPTQKQDTTVPGMSSQPGQMSSVPASKVPATSAPMSVAPHTAGESDPAFSSAFSSMSSPAADSSAQLRSSTPQMSSTPTLKLPTTLLPSTQSSYTSTPIFAGKSASQILQPQTLSDKLVSGGLKVGAAVQTALQKIPLLGNLFK